jgi:hypothetical protein
MNTIKRTAMVALFGLVSTGAFGGAIVCGKDSSIGAMNADLARRVFLGVQRNVGGHAVTVIYQNQGLTRTDFETKVVGRTGADLTSYLTALIFTGRALPAMEVTGDDGVKSRVNANPLAVGYVSDAAIDDSVRVLYRY